MKRFIVNMLESMCGALWHWHGCQLARWSDQLDQRWGTGQWKLNRDKGEA
jgi:hypothetical protein